LVDSFTGPVHVEWDREAAFTPLGQLPFFIDFLKTAGLLDTFVADCPLHYTSPNAPKKRDVLGTAMLAMLAGHKRYAHIAALRGDEVLPELLGMSRIVSEDAVRRAFATIEEEAGAVWLRRHLDYCLEPLLAEAWILDVDTTVKPLYGRQEGAVVGYNPKKPGRPSHCYHTYSMAGTRLVFDVDVCAGDQHASKHCAPGLWALLDRTPRDCWPTLLRGDKGFGNEATMREAERRWLPYLFKLRLTANIKRSIRRLSQQSEWVDAGSLSQVPTGTPVEVTFRQNRVDGWKVTSETNTAWVLKTANNEVVAYGPQCTHLGCAYHWDAGKNEFVCPCHNSVFAIDGRVVGGPAPRPLDRYQTKVEGNKPLLGQLQISPEKSA